MSRLFADAKGCGWQSMRWRTSRAGITTQIETRRFDTRFFLAVMPESQHATHDDGETSRGECMEPTEAIAAGRRGVIALPPPTWATLSKLAIFATVGEAWRWARSCPFPRVEPGFLVLEDRSRLVILPGDPRCPPVAGFYAKETRFLLERGRWRPVSS